MGIIKKVIEKNMFFGAKAELFSLALHMRKNPTEAESVMWKILRKLRQSGFPFRRQHPIEFYIADFYCHKMIFPLSHRERGNEGERPVNQIKQNS
jgi:very-short-patch-repair endonuclease